MTQHDMMGKQTIIQRYYEEEHRLLWGFRKVEYN